MSAGKLISQRMSVSLSGMREYVRATARLGGRTWGMV
jgi:hypothetical protein